MKNKKNKTNEPFTPERTPEPPQVRDPNQYKNTDADKRENPSAESNRKTMKEDPHLLNEQADITDETTI